MITSNVSIVKETIFISGLNNEKIKEKNFYLYYILHSCTCGALMLISGMCYMGGAASHAYWIVVWGKCQEGGPSLGWSMGICCECALIQEWLCQRKRCWARIEGLSQLMEWPVWQTCSDIALEKVSIFFTAHLCSVTRCDRFLPVCPI